MLIDKMNTLFKDFDAIILPTSPTTAPSIGENIDNPIAMYLADIYTVFANLTGLPAISIPLFIHSNGMPFGLQVTTNKKDELSLLQLSNLLLQQYNKSGKRY
jgi:aspartyl-tRNA(Asn)/glutamyl-tRNA(Gln) amidotransferase subunit A